MMSPRVPQRYQGARVHPGPTSPGQFRQRDPEGITGPIATAPTSLDASCSFVSSSSLFLFVLVCSFERIRVERMSLCCVVLCCVFCRRTVRFVRVFCQCRVVCPLLLPFFFFCSLLLVLFFSSFFSLASLFSPNEPRHGKKRAIACRCPSIRAWWVSWLFLLMNRWGRARDTGNDHEARQASERH